MEVTVKACEFCKGEGRAWIGASQFGITERQLEVATVGQARRRLGGKLEVNIPCPRCDGDGFAGLDLDATGHLERKWRVYAQSGLNHDPDCQCLKREKRAFVSGVLAMLSLAGRATDALDLDAVASPSAAQVAKMTSFSELVKGEASEFLRSMLATNVAHSDAGGHRQGGTGHG